MCPVCWTTALAYFSILIVVSAIATVGSDRWSLGLVGILLTLAALHACDYLPTAWWALGIVSTALATRVSWLVAHSFDQTLAYRLWNRAMSAAASRCPWVPKSSTVSVPISRFLPNVASITSQVALYSL